MMATAVAAAMTLGELLGAAAGTHAAIVVSDLVLDHRQVTPGAAFVALPGSRTHGLQFAEPALAAGAVAVLYEPDPERSAPAPSVPVPGLSRRLGELARTFFGGGRTPPEIAAVTGTNGKTTVAYLLAQAFGQLGSECAYIGTLGYGVPPRVTAHALTTPDCLTLHREMAALGTARVAMEASSHALVQDRLAGLAIGTALFTNLTRDHLDAHGDFASYGRAKARLFQRPELGAAVLNNDDGFAAELAGMVAPDVVVLTTSLEGDADLVGRYTSRHLDGLTLAIAGTRGSAQLVSPLIGRFNAANLMSALGALVACGVRLETAAAALAACSPPKGRMEVQGGGRVPYVVVDYAHTPDALERVLTSLRAVAAGEVWCVFGCGGERDRGKRALMGEVAARHAEHLVLTDDNPRGEDPVAIVADIRTGVGAHPSVTIVHARERAIAHAVHTARVGDVVLVAGKGHESVQIVGSRTMELDDHDVVAAVLGGRA